jgi:hypothetical protein
MLLELKHQVRRGAVPVKNGVKHSVIKTMFMFNVTSILFKLV